MIIIVVGGGIIIAAPAGRAGSMGGQLRQFIMLLLFGDLIILNKMRFQGKSAAEIFYSIHAHGLALGRRRHLIRRAPFIDHFHFLHNWRSPTTTCADSEKNSLNNDNSVGRKFIVNRPFVIENELAGQPLPVNDFSSQRGPQIKLATIFGRKD